MNRGGKRIDYECIRENVRSVTQLFGLNHKHISSHALGNSGLG
jgi:hypothetical protein